MSWNPRRKCILDLRIQEAHLKYLWSQSSLQSRHFFLFLHLYLFHFFGDNGVFCLYFLWCIYSFLRTHLITWFSQVSPRKMHHVRLFATSWTVARQLPLVHGDSPGQNTGVGFYALLQGIFSTQGSNPGLPHCRRILYHLSHQGTPRIPE